MHIPTSRFGTVTYRHDDVLTFPHGLIGMESCQQWVLLADSENDALGWLQSAERPELALAVVSPRRFIPGYQVRVSAREVESVAPVRGADLQGFLSVCGERLSHANGNLFTLRHYDDFVLRFEFKLSPGANNGVAIRSPFQETGGISYEGMELQILDNREAVKKPRRRPLQPYQMHGSLYGIYPAKTGFLKPAGQWNEQEVHLEGRRLRVTLNGTVILDVNLDEAYAADRGDGRDRPGHRNETGRIGFLGHRDRVWFRNIRIRELP